MPGSRSKARELVRRSAAARALAKAPSGIVGFDDIAGGGLPRGRATLVCGGTGSGKTLFGMAFVLRGAVDYGEPGVFMAFEETGEELEANFASLGFDLKRLESEKRVVLDTVALDASDIVTGPFDLEGLFVRMEDAIERVRARRIVLDSIETLFSALPDPKRLRAELRRLLRWLKQRGLTVVFTGERGERTLSRHGFEEYVSDCVVVLDHRTTAQISTRRLRIVKYRGSTHGTNEYPFLIDEDGISISAITSLALAHEAPAERVSTGIDRLDQMLGGKGYFRGSTVLASGSPGSGKTIFAMHLARAACERGERCLVFAMEESPSQLERNVSAVGIELAPYVERGLLHVSASRPTAYGLEMHLATMSKRILELDPRVVVIDPVTSLLEAGNATETQMMLTRLVDLLKTRGTTAFFTSLVAPAAVDVTDVGISSLVDTWLMLQVVQSGGERNRLLTIVKSRGMAHSNQSVEYRIGDHGIEVVDTYVGPTGVLTGSARIVKEAEDESAIAASTDVIARKEHERERRRHTLERNIAELREAFEAEDSALADELREAKERRDRLLATRAAMARSRQAFAAAPPRSVMRRARRSR